MRARFLLAMFVFAISSWGLLHAQDAQNAQDTQDTQVASVLEEAELGTTRNVHVCGDLFLSGQFSRDDLREIKERGITRIITLREPGEIDWNEPDVVRSMGMEHIAIPFRSPDSLTDEVFDRVRESLADEDETTLLHCASANRVGAVWLTFRVLDQGADLETAIEEAQVVGMSNQTYQEKALDYIRRHDMNRDKEEDLPPVPTAQADGSINPGINESFLDPDLDIDAFVRRFEVESREVFAARHDVIRECGISSGDRIADIGAGTGFYTQLFAREVGSAGWVFAVDISPKFIEHINNLNDAVGISNVTGVVCRDDSVALPPESIDVAFICDTYHHFEFPASTGKSIFHALRSGGTLVVIDFERIPGETRPWLMEHVRAGKDEFRAEIESCGFEFVAEIEIDEFEENYFLKFRKP